MFKRFTSTFTKRLLAITITTSGFSVAAVSLWRQDREATVSKTLPDESKVIKEKLQIEEANLTYAPWVPPPIRRNYPVRLRVNIDTTSELRPVSLAHKYLFWTFNKQFPGPFIRARVGDTLEVSFTNKDESGMAHNIDFHAVTGPGGGSELLLAELDETKTATFKLLYPGLFFYHCAAAPVPVHIANGMYGLLLVEPEEGLPEVDREFYVMQSEIYGEQSSDDPKLLEFSYVDGLNEKPRYVVFNGKAEALTESPLQVKTGDRVRVYFGNAGPNLVSSFHIIGTIFDKVYREGSLISPPERSLQTTLVPSGGASIVEINAVVPGNYTLVDHSIFRIDKGAVGFLKVSGKPRPDIYASDDNPKRCVGCKLHS